MKYKLQAGLAVFVLFGIFFWLFSAQAGKTLEYILLGRFGAEAVMVAKSVADQAVEKKFFTMDANAQASLGQHIIDNMDLPDGLMAGLSGVGGRVVAFSDGAQGSYGKDPRNVLDQVTWLQKNPVGSTGVFHRIIELYGHRYFVVVVPIANTWMKVFALRDISLAGNEAKHYISRIFYSVLIMAICIMFFGIATGFISIRGMVGRKIRERNKKAQGVLKVVNEERNLYYKALYNSPHGMMVTDKQGCIVLVNPAFEDIYGFTLGETKGRNPTIVSPGTQTFYDLGYSSVSGQDIFSHIWEEVTKPDGGVWEGEMPNKQKDGTIIWVRLLVQALKNGYGKITNFVWFPVDITESLNREFAVRMEIYQTIMDIAQRRDYETSMHLTRVSLYSGILARQMGLSEKMAKELEIYAPLHDIGKVGIMDKILLAPRRFTEQEMEVMKTHAAIGHDMLKDKPSLAMAAEIAYCHHEKFDGTGYPQGLSREDIPLTARIVALADVYDALRSKRTYKDAWNHPATVDEITSLAGTHLDPDVVDAFLARQDEFYYYSQKYQDQ